MFQTKEWNKTPEENPNETEISDLPDKKFKETFIRALIKLRKRMQGLSENFNEDLENIRKNQSKLKNTITEIKNTPKGINSRVDDTEELISDLKDRIVKITQSEPQKEERVLKMRV